jgi:hypothetical protein
MPWLGWLQRYEFSFYRPAVCAVEFSGCKIAVGRMGFNEGKYCRVMAPRTRVINIKSERHIPDTLWYKSSEKRRLIHVHTIGLADEKSKENPDSLHLHGSLGFASAIGAFVGPNLGPFTGVDNAFYEKGISPAFLAADCQPE